MPATGQDGLPSVVRVRTGRRPGRLRRRPDAEKSEVWKLRVWRLAWFPGALNDLFTSERDRRQ